MTSESAAPGSKPDATRSAAIDSLHDWRCFEVLQAGRTERTHHIVGSICRVLDGRDARQGCVTGALTSVDPDTRTIRTEDGTSYRLGR